jgi:multidrug efflux system membrane fusion protein
MYGVKTEKMVSAWKRNGIALTAGAAACVLLAVVYGGTAHQPRTDDASVRANYIQLAPEVSGRLIDLRVKDNQHVKAGNVLFVIDPRPYQYALNLAVSEQQQLEEQIRDMQRRISGETSAIRVARAGLAGARLQSQSSGSATHAADAAVERAKAYLEAMEAQKTLAENNLRRMEPLLARQFVTTEQVDDARTKAKVAEFNQQQARAALAEAEAQQARTRSQQMESVVGETASAARVEQSRSAVERLETLEAQRGAKMAQVEAARLDVERCTVRAPFDGYVTNLNISEGEMAKPGVALFTLIDSRNWYVVANYRESELRRFHTGQHVDLYLPSAPSRRFDGVVESIGSGVAPEQANVSNGLPQIDHTLNWVHLAARFPVRIRVVDPDANLFRMGQSAISVAR